ncbi:MAG: phosphatidylserine/phosphatidylglycerophosphate/cardiolipin synthase family protein [Halobacteriaceae archaeon]
MNRWLLLAGAAAGVLTVVLAAPAVADGPTEVRIEAVYANPIAPNDVGEYVTIAVAPQTNLGAYTLTDGESSIALPNRTVSGRVRLSTTPRAVRNQTHQPRPPVVGIDGSLSLANGGERISITRNGSVVESLTYGELGESERWQNGSAVPRGMTAFQVATTSPRAVQTFVLPDGSQVVQRTLSGAEDRVLVAGYTFTSPRVAAELAAAAARGATVRVLIEVGPVGGVSRRTATVLSWLSKTPVQVRVLDGPLSRFRFHHPKYAVVDDRSLISSENWKPSGLGGHGTRGWGALVRGAETADALAAVFSADWEWAAAQPWQAYSAGATFQPPSPATATYPSRFPPDRESVEAARLLVAPDNAEPALLALLRRAQSSIRVVQPTIGNGTPLRGALLRAARRGVHVRILLSGVWYNEAENRGIAADLRRIARREGLPLKVQLASPRSRYSHLHAKGLVIDGQITVLGSINWNVVSTRENREVAVVLYGTGAAQYYRRVFRADWRGAAWRLPGTVGVVTAGGVALVIALVRRAVSFDEQPAAPRPVQPPPSSRPARQAPPPASRERT